MRDVFHAARAEAGVGGVVIDRRQDVPAAFAFVAVGFLYANRERIAFFQTDGRGDEEEAQFIPQAGEVLVRRVRRGDVQRRFERAADEAVFARVFQRQRRCRSW